MIIIIGVYVVLLGWLSVDSVCWMFVVFVRVCLFRMMKIVGFWKIDCVVVCMLVSNKVIKKIFMIEVFLYFCYVKRGVDFGDGYNIC